MAIIFTCSCGQPVHVPEDRAESVCRCTHCGSSLQVPAMGIVEPAGRRRPGRRRAPSSKALTRRHGLTPLVVLSAGLILVSATLLIVNHLDKRADAEGALALGNAAVQNLQIPVKRTETSDDAPSARSRPATRTTGESPVPDRPKTQPIPEKKGIPLPARPTAPPFEKLAPVPPPKKPVGPLLRLEWKLKPGDKFYQELRVAQKPTFRVQGLPITSSLQYVVVSSFAVLSAGDKLVLRQKVESARLIEADPLTQGLLAPLIVKLPGTRFTVELNSRMEVTRFSGADDVPAIGKIEFPGVQGFQMASLLDRDGWKEMAQLTFFQPNRTLKPMATWTTPLSHNWGALGSWQGKSRYTYAGHNKSLHQFDYTLELVHQPGAGGLISAAAFQIRQAGGSIIFDAERSKVIQAREQFRVSGRLSLLGQNMDIEEDQLFLLRILDRQKALPKADMMR